MCVFGQKKKGVDQALSHKQHIIVFAKNIYCAAYALQNEGQISMLEYCLCFRPSMAVTSKHRGPLLYRPP